jgi:TfoX/Sxy family transcriptional regulator of competence genes
VASVDLKTQRIQQLDRCLEGHDVEIKRLFGADGRAHSGKVFAMVTKHGEFVVKCNEEDHFLGLQADGAQRWSPHASRGPMGRWLVLTDEMLEDDDLVRATLERRLNHLNTD